MKICEIKVFRKKHRISAQALSKAAHINPAVLSRIENGWLTINAEQMEKIVSGFASFGVNASWDEISQAKEEDHGRAS